MDSAQIAAALKKHPCPTCGVDGQLEPQHMDIRVTHKGQEVVAEGEGTVCHACDGKFMCDELTENLANQVQRIDGGFQRYIEVDRQSGKLQAYSIQ
jgi:hypothetical protein